MSSFIRHCTTRSNDKVSTSKYFLEVDHSGSASNKGKSSEIYLSRNFHPWVYTPSIQRVGERSACRGFGRPFAASFDCVISRVSRRRGPRKAVENGTKKRGTRRRLEREHPPPWSSILDWITLDVSLPSVRCSDSCKVRERRATLIGRMIPPNPENLESRGRSVALSEIRGKMDLMPRAKERKNSLGGICRGSVEVAGWNVVDRESLEIQRIASMLVNLGRGPSRRENFNVCVFPFSTSWICQIVV